MAQMEYHAKDDYRETREDVEGTLGFVPEWLDALSEEDLINEWPSFNKYTFGETEIPAKYRELMGLAVAANIKCPYCQHFHREAAKMHGATEAELEEVHFLASITARYSAMLHAQHYDQDTFEEEFDRIAAHLSE
jgi:AhpD family alkylhydroperoxidase